MMEATSTDLVTWLREQITVDERRAQRASDDGADSTWRVKDLTAQGYLEDEMADHVATWDPARVLAECDAKRRLLRQFQLRAASIRKTVAPSTGGVWDDLLRLLALPYADRPGYQEQWRP